MAITDMTVRGAGAIGAAAAFAMAQAFLEAPETDTALFCKMPARKLKVPDPLPETCFCSWAGFEAGQISAENAKVEAQRIALQDIEDCNAIGEYGNKLIKITHAYSHIAMRVGWHLWIMAAHFRQFM